MTREQAIHEAVRRTIPFCGCYVDELPPTASDRKLRRAMLDGLSSCGSCAACREILDRVRYEFRQIWRTAA